MSDAGIAPAGAQAPLTAKDALDASAPAAGAHAPFTGLEVAAVLVGCAYLLSPWRVFDIPFFLLGALALAYSKRATWPSAPRSRLMTYSVAGLSATVAVGLFAYGLESGAPAMTARAFGLIGVIYVPSAALQQYITQAYLVGRLGRRLGGRSNLTTAVVGGAIFSAGHLPLDGLVLPTFFCGVIWSLAFMRGARLSSLVFSHALLATLWFLAVLGRDPFRALGLT